MTVKTVIVDDWAQCVVQKKNMRKKKKVYGKCLQQKRIRRLKSKTK